MTTTSTEFNDRVSADEVLVPSVTWAVIEYNELHNYCFTYNDTTFKILYISIEIYVN